MITLEKVKTIREAKKDDPNKVNPIRRDKKGRIVDNSAKNIRQVKGDPLMGPPEMFDFDDEKGVETKKDKSGTYRSAKKQGPTTKKSVSQVKGDIEFRQNLRKAGGSGDVSDKAGPDIRKRVETIRKTRADKLGVPDPIDPDYDKKVIKGPGFGKKPVTTSSPGFGKGDTTGQMKVKAMDKRAFKVTKPTDDLLPKSFKDFDKKIKSLKVDTDIEKTIKKAEKKANVYKTPKPIKSVSKPPYPRFDNREPFSDDDLGQRTGKTGDKVVNKLQKPSTKVSNTVSKTFKKNKSVISQNPDLTRRRQLGAAGMDSNFQGGGAGGSTAGGTGSSTKGSTILGPDGKPLAKSVKSTVSKRIPKSQRTYTQSKVEDMLKKAKSQYRTNIDSGKEAIRQTKQQARKAGQDFANAANRRMADTANDAFRKGTKYGTDQTLKSSQKFTDSMKKENERLKREIKNAQKGSGTGTGSFKGVGATNVEKLKTAGARLKNLGMKGSKFSKATFAKNFAKKAPLKVAKGLAKFAVNRPLLALGGLAVAGAGVQYLRGKQQQDFFNKNTTPTKKITGADGKPMRFYGNPDKGQSNIRDLPQGFKSGKFKVKDSAGKNINVVKNYQNSEMAKQFRNINKKITQNQKITNKQQKFFNRTKKNMKAFGVTT